MVFGDSSNLDSAEIMVSKAKALAIQTGRADLLYFVNKLKISMNSLTRLSVWTLCKYFKTTSVSDETVKTYVEKSLIQHGRFYLYPSQLQALEEGILDSSRKNVLVAMPTGSGKTLISELIMINTLMGLQQNSLAIFMAPSRALVHEKFDELFRSVAALNLKVCQITGEVAMESEAQITDYDVAVVTPEKFDMLMRKRLYGAKTGL